MCLHLNIPDDIERALRRQAEKSGVPAEVIAARLIERSVRVWEEFERAAQPARDAFAASGMTEDEAVELFEAEKHAMRAEGRKKAS